MAPRYNFILALILLLHGELVTAQGDDASLTNEYKEEIAVKVMQLLKDEYVLPDKAIIAADEVKRRLEAGFYDPITDLQTFANRLTGTLDIIDDWHLGVNYYPDPIREDYDYWSPTEEEISDRREFLKSRNYGFEKVERLVGNIGYIEVRDFFYEESHSETILASAMAFVANTDGLIIDLRRNGGGQAEIIQLFISYLVEEKVLIGTTNYRKDNRSVEYWTLDDVDGPKYPTDRPVYLVVSNSTFSAAEAFTYALQTLNRATVFGEETIGGAHPTDNMRLDEHLMIRMPVASSIDPRTGSNWQYIGIQPDFLVDAAGALTSAHEAMLERLVDNSGNILNLPEKESALREIRNN
ncbi:MAG: S41 family peptidase [Gammaproteobacteria bacterium]